MIPSPAVVAAPALGTAARPAAPDVPSDAPDADPAATPLGFGVAARVTGAVLADDYARVLVGVLSRLDQTGLVRETGDVSTYLGGHETSLQRYLIDLAADLADTGHHCTLSVTLSRGCPGEVVC